MRCHEGERSRDRILSALAFLFSYSLVMVAPLSAPGEETIADPVVDVKYEELGDVAHKLGAILAGDLFDAFSEDLAHYDNGLKQKLFLRSLESRPYKDRLKHERQLALRKLYSLDLCSIDSGDWDEDRRLFRCLLDAEAPMNKDDCYVDNVIGAKRLISHSYLGASDDGFWVPQIDTFLNSYHAKYARIPVPEKIAEKVVQVEASEGKDSVHVYLEIILQPSTYQRQFSDCWDGGVSTVGHPAAKEAAIMLVSKKSGVIYHGVVGAGKRKSPAARR